MGRVVTVKPQFTGRRFTVPPIYQGVLDETYARLCMDLSYLAKRGSLYLAYLCQGVAERYPMPQYCGMTLEGVNHVINSSTRLFNE